MGFAWFFPRFRRQTQPLTVFIGDWPAGILTAEGIEMTVRPMFVEVGEELHELREVTFSRPVSMVRLMLLEEQETRALDIPHRVLRAMAAFLTTHHAQVHMDYMCFDFTHETAFGGSRPRGRSTDGDYDLQNISPAGWTFRPGDIVMLHRGRDGNKTPHAHAAVYIGRNLFLSVYGAGGDLEVSTLADMQRDFQTPFVALAKPRY